MRNFIKALPNELFEAARIDGTSEFNIFLKIVVPLTRPAIAALSVLIFTLMTNHFVCNLTYDTTEIFYHSFIFFPPFSSKN